MRNNFVNGLINQGIQVSNTPWPAYQICGWAGFGLSILVVVGLIMKVNLSIWILMIMIFAAVFTFFSLAMITKIILGEERLIYYHHEIAILLATMCFLKILHQPALPYLDITVLSIGAFLFCGRIGCLMVGCCHGKPYHWGVCYTEEHKEAGFTPYLVGVRLFPVQLLESLFVLLVIIVGTALVLSRAYRPGEALTWYVIAYGAARFFFEFLRGDPDRPYFAGFSEAQWISLILMGLVIVGESAGKLPFHAWHAGAVLLIAVVMTILSINRKFSKTNAYDISLARHIRDVARAVDEAAKCIRPSIAVVCTFLGYRISAGRIATPTGWIHHYAFSKEQGILSQQAAQALVDLTLKLKHPDGVAEIVKGNEGVFHLLVHT